MVTFAELGINKACRGITELGFDSPMAIQEKVIPILLAAETDIIALAQTGTGKTGAFGLPLIQLTNLQSQKVQTLILSPTRELCLQITDDLKNYAKYIPGLKVAAVYGGADSSRQIRKIEKGAQIIVATPGRMDDLLNKRKKINISKVRFVVLDEADEMLSMGFKDELDAILDKTPGTKTTLLFSATMQPEIRNISKNYLVNPIEISAGERNIGADDVHHIRYSVHEKHRYLALKRIVDYNPNIYGIIFCRTREDTKNVAKKLIEDGYNADALHGDLSQVQREAVMHRFRSRNLQLLTATDVAARGLDIKDLTHIINYNLPDEAISYIHRSGRTGRAGQKGISIIITNLKENKKIAGIEKLLRKKFELCEVPSGTAICETQLLNIVDRLEKIQVDHQEIDKFLPAVYDKLSWLDRDELIKHFVALEFNRFLKYYKNAADLQTVSTSTKEIYDKPRKSEGLRKKRVPYAAEQGFTRFYINLGEKHQLTPPDLIGLVIRGTRRKNVDIGKINIMKKFSFFEVDELHANAVLTGFKNMDFKGIKVIVELTRIDFGPEMPSPRKKKVKRRKKARRLV